MQGQSDQQKAALEALQQEKEHLRRQHARELKALREEYENNQVYHLHATAHKHTSHPKQGYSATMGRMRPVQVTSSGIGGHIVSRCR